MDPLAFNPQSALGIPGLLSAVRSGRVALANALGTGVADDKAMYCYVPRMIEFYLGEHTILNNVLTYMLRDPKQRQHVFNNLHNLVVKEVQGSGGYGMLIGPASTAEEREAYKLKVMQLHAARHPEQILGGAAQHQLRDTVYPWRIPELWSACLSMVEGNSDMRKLTSSIRAVFGGGGGGRVT